MTNNYRQKSLTSFLKFQASGIQQQVDPRIAEEIHYLVGKGIINVNEMRSQMRRHLGEYLTMISSVDRNYLSVKIPLENLF